MWEKWLKIILDEKAGSPEDWEMEKEQESQGLFPQGKIIGGKKNWQGIEIIIWKEWQE